MDDIKPGDTVWVKTEVGQVRPDWIETDTDSGKGFFREDWGTYLIRDHPSLPAVAALLTEPGLAEAVQFVAAEMARSDCGLQHASVPTKRIIARLAAALNGGRHD